MSAASEAELWSARHRATQKRDRATGSFILIDEATKNTVAAAAAASVGVHP